MDSALTLPAATVLLFAVDLDGKAIGTHEFRVEPEDGSRVTVHSTASFGVRVLGIPVYRYRHDANERWTDGCVHELTATTDDNGRKSRVRAQSSDDGLRITTSGPEQVVPGCVRAFAYWRPQWLQAAQLLNPQTGLMEPAKLTPLGEGKLSLLDGRTVDTRHLRLDAGKLSIELWYSSGDEWLQLQSTTSEGRHLRYRRRDAPQ